VLDLFISGLTTYGPLALCLAMFPGIVGVPMPVGVLLIAAGAFTREGLMAWQAVFLCAWLGTMVSDSLTYALGRWAGGWVQGRLSGRSVEIWRQAEERFKNHGDWAVFVTSWLIRGPAYPTNIIAGSSHYSFWRFIAWDAAGKLIWIMIHAGLGYTFASQWQRVSETTSSVGNWLGLCAVVGICIYLVLRRVLPRLQANQGLP
jgi:membrane-associated protein